MYVGSVDEVQLEKSNNFCSTSYFSFLIFESDYSYKSAYNCKFWALKNVYVKNAPFFFLHQNMSGISCRWVLKLFIWNNLGRRPASYLLCLCMCILCFYVSCPISADHPGRTRIRDYWQATESSAITSQPAHEHAISIEASSCILVGSTLFGARRRFQPECCFGQVRVSIINDTPSESGCEQ